MIKMVEISVNDEIIRQSIWKNLNYIKNNIILLFEV